MPARTEPTRWSMYIAAVGFVLCSAHAAFGQKSAEPIDELRMFRPGEAKTNTTVPSSPYANSTMSLREQETRSRNSGAGQQVTRDLNSDFVNYREPVAAVALVAAILASAVLALKAAWIGIPLVSAMASVIQRGFFRWPTSPLEWVNKLAIYIGLSEFALRLAT